jgi:hypothetical protein
MLVNTESMTKLAREINRLGTPAKLTTTDTTDGPTFLIEVGAPWHTAGSDTYEVLISADSSAVPGDPGSLVYGVYDQDWRAQYVRVSSSLENALYMDPKKHKSSQLAEVVVEYHADMVAAGVYA